MILPTDRTMFQNAWVCDDLDAAMKKWTDHMKVGPWFIAEHDENITNVLYRGQPADLSMRVALAQAGHLDLEALITGRRDLDGINQAFDDITTTTDIPIVIQDDDGKDIGVIDKTTLLKGIQGGKA